MCSLPLLQSGMGNPHLAEKQEHSNTHVQRSCASEVRRPHERGPSGGLHGVRVKTADCDERDKMRASRQIAHDCRQVDEQVKRAAGKIVTHVG